MKITRQEIKQIIKEELENVLIEQEISRTANVTYGQLDAILKLASAVKSGAGRDTLTGIIKTGDFGNNAKGLLDLFSQLAENKIKLNEEPLTLSMAIGALFSTLGAVSGAKTIASLGKKAFNRLKGDSTEKTDRMPILDTFNLDPKLSAVLDDRLEEEFINWWQSKIRSKVETTPGAFVDVDDLDVNLLLPIWLKSSYPDIDINQNQLIPPVNWSMYDDASLSIVRDKIKKIGKRKAVDANI